MSIYKHLGKNYGFEGTLESTMEIEEMASEIEDFEKFHEEMVKESAIDMANVRGGMYVAEQLIENALFTAEDHEVEALIEGAVGDFFTKIKENLIKLWNKIKAWFKHITDMIKRFFMSGKDLVKKYKSQIKNAAAKHGDIEVKCYKWKPAALSARAKKMIDGINSAAKTQAENGNSNPNDFDVAEAKKKILTDGAGVDKVGEIAKEIKSFSRPGEKEKHTITELGGIDAIMKAVEDQSTTISDIEKYSKGLDVSMREAISKVDQEAKRAMSKDSESIGDLKKGVSIYSEVIRYGATLRTNVVKVHTSEVKTMCKQLTAVLKALLNKSEYKENIKGTKESAFADVYDLLGY